MRSSCLNLITFVAMPTMLLIFASACESQTSPTTTEPFAVFHPFHPSQPLPGHVIGIIAIDVTGRFNYEGPYRGEQPKEHPLGFATGDDDYRNFSWPCPGSKGETTSALVGPNADIKKEFTGICEATTRNAEAMGITPPFALVDTEINGGLGGAAWRSPILTHLNVIHKTEKYPLDPVVVMATAKARLENYKEAHATAITEKMPILQSKAMGTQKPKGPRQEKTHILITWLPESEHIRITIQWTTIDGTYGLGQGTRPPSHPGEKRGPATTQDASVATSGITFGLEGGVVLEFSKDGNLVKEVDVSPKEFVKQLNPA